MKNNLIESDYINQHQFLIFKLAKLFADNPNTMLELIDNFPIYIFLNERVKLNYTNYNEFVNQIIKNNYQKDIEKDSVDFFKSISNEQMFYHSMKKISEYNENNNPLDVCTTFHYTSFFNQTNWYFSHKIIVSNDEFLNITYPLCELGNIGEVISKFIDPLVKDLTIWKKFKSLTTQEKKLLLLFVEGVSNQEISELMGISVNTVRTHRDNIRNKLQIRGINQMIQFTKAFNIIDAF